MFVKMDITEFYSTLLQTLPEKCTLEISISINTEDDGKWHIGWRARGPSDLAFSDWVSVKADTLSNGFNELLEQREKKVYHG